MAFGDDPARVYVLEEALAEHDAGADKGAVMPRKNEAETRLNRMRLRRPGPAEETPECVEGGNAGLRWRTGRALSCQRSKC
jgi:hypothetical protein